MHHFLITRQCILNISLTILFIISLLLGEFAHAEPEAFLAEDSPPSQGIICDTISEIDLATGTVTFLDPCPPEICVGQDECGNCPGETNPIIKDDCGICGGSGKDQCGNCPGTVNPILLDECGICGGNGKDECGSCSGATNPIVKDSCGVCGGPGTDACNRCPGEADYDASLSSDDSDNNGVVDACEDPVDECINKDICGNCPGQSNPILKDECGICGGDGKDECGNCPGAVNPVVKDSCGVCGGPGTDACNRCPGETDYNPATSEIDLDANAVADACEVPLDGCYTYKLEFNVIDGGVGKKVSIEGDDLIQPSCLSGIIDEAIRLGKESVDDRRCATSNFCQTRYYDNCAVAYLVDDPYWKPGCGIEEPSPFKLYSSRSSSVGTGAWTQGATVYMDKNCNSLTEDDEIFANGEPCDAGNLRWTSTPISLLWDNNHKIDKDVRLVNFPIDPGKAGEWFIWKASDKAPLLVHDPSHSGKITSAHQLFGDWTFGGKKYAKAGSNNTQVASSKWKDGFEPLATLDTNKDGQVSGSELEPLALWFDSNRDGVSDAGEVVALSKTEVTALFYQGDKKDSFTGNTTLEKGFLRKDGTIGIAVDWRTDSALSPEELVNKHVSSLLSVEEESLQAENQNVTPAAAAPKEETAELSKEVNVDGIWQWKVVGSDTIKGFNASGYFDLAQNVDGDLVGHSYGEVLPRNNKKLSSKVRSQITILALKGSVAESSGRTSINYELQDAGKGKVFSKASLSSNGLTMEGITTAQVYYQNQPLTITYEWIATKM